MFGSGGSFRVFAFRGAFASFVLFALVALLALLALWFGLLPSIQIVLHCATDHPCSNSNADYWKKCLCCVRGAGDEKGGDNRC